LFSRDDANRAFDQATAVGARFIASVEPGYSPILRITDGAPPIICVKGDLGQLNRSSVAIAGARNASAIGRKFTRQIAAEIGAAGHTIVSGLARGIDTASHEAALSTGTVAVLAGGVDVIYPPENARLHAEIAERGLIVSEQLPGTEPRAEFFPRRNRIISGLARALIVVEAAVRSGSLITARLAAEQGREVFAVPGFPLDPRCEGTNRLIRDGATLLTSAQDVLAALDQQVAQSHASFLEQETPVLAPAAATGAHRTLLGLLSPTPIEADALIRESGLDAPTVSAVLLDLTLTGQVIRHPNGAVSLG
jgi:DNA processing protein